MRINVTPQTDPDVFALISVRNILRRLTPEGRKRVIDFIVQEQKEKEQGNG